MSYCPRNYYILPADRCEEAASMYRLAREDAMRAKKEIWRDKYGASGAIAGAGTKGDGLVFDDIEQAKAQINRGGFCKLQHLPVQMSDRNDRAHWLLKPNRATKRGKEIAADMEYVTEMLDIWEYALEKALGVGGTVFFDHAFHVTRARLLRDGRVIVSAAQDRNKPRGNGLSRNFEATVMPDWAVAISQEEHDRLALEADRYEEVA